MSKGFLSRSFPILKLFAHEGPFVLFQTQNTSDTPNLGHLGFGFSVVIGPPYTMAFPSPHHLRLFPKGTPWKKAHLLSVCKCDHESRL